MANQIEREAWVKQDKLKNPIHYVRGTDLLPIVFHFRDFTIPSGATARVFVAKPDGNPVYDSATIEGNDVTVDVTEQMFLVLGMTLMQISIFGGEKELVSFAQPVMVEQNLKAGDLPESTTDVSFLDDAIEQANQAVNTATTAASQAAQAVKNANQAIADANKAISDLNEQTASLNTNFALLSNNVSISQLDTTAKTIAGALNELNGNFTPQNVAITDGDYGQLTGNFKRIGSILIFSFYIVLTKEYSTNYDALFTFNTIKSSARYDFPTYTSRETSIQVYDLLIPNNSNTPGFNIGNNISIPVGTTLFCSGTMLVTDK